MTIHATHTIKFNEGREEKKKWGGGRVEYIHVLFFQQN